MFYNRNVQKVELVIKYFEGMRKPKSKLKSLRTFVTAASFQANTDKKEFVSVNHGRKTSILII